MWEDDEYYDEDNDEFYEDEELEDFGCLYGNDCVMSYCEHLPSECHTAEMLEEQYREQNIQSAWYWPIVKIWREVYCWFYWKYFYIRVQLEPQREIDVEDIPF